MTSSDSAPSVEAALAKQPDAHLLVEGDALARLRGVDRVTRLASLEDHLDLLVTRDDLVLHYVDLLLDVGRLDDAWAHLTGRTFGPFADGGVAALAAFDRASCMRARRWLDERPYEAIALLENGISPPTSLGGPRPPGSPTAERYLLLGDGLASVGDARGAQAAWVNAVASDVLGSGDRISEDVFWRGVAHVRLGEHAKADAAWQRLDEGAADVDHPDDALRLRELAERGRALSAARSEGPRRTS